MAKIGQNGSASRTTLYGGSQVSSHGLNPELEVFGAGGKLEGDLWRDFAAFVGVEEGLIEGLYSVLDIPAFDGAANVFEAFPHFDEIAHGATTNPFFDWEMRWETTACITLPGCLRI
jgi:hypothetical protein